MNNPGLRRAALAGVFALALALWPAGSPAPAAAHAGAGESSAAPALMRPAPREAPRFQSAPAGWAQGRGAASGAPQLASQSSAAGDAGTGPPPLRWLWRAAALLAASGLLGGPLFSSLVLGAAPADDTQALAPALGRRLAWMLIGLSVLLIVALVADMLYQIAAPTGGDALSALGDLGAAPTLITTTGYGAYWALRVAESLALLGYGLWRLRSPGRLDWTAAVLGAGLLLAGEALSSHGAAAPPVFGLPLAMLSDLVHLLAAGAWIGGLLYLAWALLPVLRRAPSDVSERLLGRLVPRFSNLALASAGALVVTGVANLATHSLDPVVIVDSDYGRLLVLKHLLFLPLLALGALNNRLIQPRLVVALAGAGGAVAAGAAGRLSRAVAVQATLAVAIVLCAAGLTLLPPPEAAAPVAAAPAPGVSTPRAPAAPVTLRQTVSGVQFALTVRPDPAGDQFALALTRVDPAAPPLTDALQLQLRLTPQDLEAGEDSLPVNPAGPPDPDHLVYTATAQALTLSGAYQLNAEFLRRASPDLRAGFRLTLADDGALTMQQSEVLRALLTTRPSPPLTGTAAITIRVIDGQDQPVAGAAVTLLPLMPSHGHFEPRSDAQPVPGQPGLYQTEANLPMGGPWLMIVEVTRPGGLPVKTSATIDVIDPAATPTPPQ